MHTLKIALIALFLSAPAHAAKNVVVVNGADAPVIVAPVAPLVVQTEADNPLAVRVQKGTYVEFSHIFESSGTFALNFRIPGVGPRAGFLPAGTRIAVSSISVSTPMSAYSPVRLLTLIRGAGWDGPTLAALATHPAGSYVHPVSNQTYPLYSGTHGGLDVEVEQGRSMTLKGGLHVHGQTFRRITFSGRVID